MPIFLILCKLQAKYIFCPISRKYMLAAETFGTKFDALLDQRSHFPRIFIDFKARLGSKLESVKPKNQFQRFKKFRDADLKSRLRIECQMSVRCRVSECKLRKTRHLEIVR